jgi:hypothetical protein
LLSTSIRPPLLVNGAEDAGSFVFLEKVHGRILLEGAVVREETADGLSIHLTSGEVDEALPILTAVLHHWQCIHEVAVNGVQRPSVVIGWGANSSQVDHLITQRYKSHSEESAVFPKTDSHTPNRINQGQETKTNCAWAFLHSLSQFGVCKSRRVWFSYDKSHRKLNKPLETPGNFQKESNDQQTEGQQLGPSIGTTSTMWNPERTGKFIT